MVESVTRIGYHKATRRGERAACLISTHLIDLPPPPAAAAAALTRVGRQAGRQAIIVFLVSLQMIGFSVNVGFNNHGLSRGFITALSAGVVLSS
jgi:hypothetical protein